MKTLLHSLKEINTEDKAYFVGLCAADGTIDFPYSVRIGLLDKEVLVKIRDWIDPKATILPDSKGTPRLHLNSKKLVSDLALHNIVSNKSLTLRPPTALPCSLVKSFVLGYFDGDGSISYGKRMASLQVRIVSGSFEILDFIDRSSSNYVTEGAIYEAKDKRNGSITYQLCWNSHRGIKFLDWIYSSETLLNMDRKYEDYKVARKLPFKHRHSSSCKTWTSREVLLLQENFLKVKTTCDLSELLPGRSVTSIRAKALSLGFTRNGRRNQHTRPLREEG